MILMAAAGWNTTAFKGAMGIAQGGAIDLQRGKVHADGYLALTETHPFGNTSMTFYDSAFSSKK